MDCGPSCLAMIAKTLWSTALFREDNLLSSFIFLLASCFSFVLDADNVSKGWFAFGHLLQNR